MWKKGKEQNATKKGDKAKEGNWKRKRGRSNCAWLQQELRWTGKWLDEEEMGGGLQYKEKGAIFIIF